MQKRPCRLTETGLTLRKVLDMRARITRRMTDDEGDPCVTLEPYHPVLFISDLIGNFINRFKKRSARHC